MILEFISFGWDEQEFNRNSTRLSDCWPFSPLYFGWKEKETNIFRNARGARITSDILPVFLLLAPIQLGNGRFLTFRWFPSQPKIFGSLGLNKSGKKRTMIDISKIDIYIYISLYHKPYTIYLITINPRVFGTVFQLSDHIFGSHGPKSEAFRRAQRGGRRPFSMASTGTIWS